uniref:Ig-like domain-containing protein n=1 Tax=Leptobrachium leishanense TaxID=445787 RepID=A0A8C5PT01_9ANUR
MSLTSIPSVSTIYQPTMFNYERPKHFIQSQQKCQGEPISPGVTAPKPTNVVAKSSIYIQPQSFSERNPPPLCATSTTAPSLTVSISSMKKTEAPAPAPAPIQSSTVSLSEHISDQYKQEPYAFQSTTPFNNFNVDRKTSNTDIPECSKYTVKHAPKQVQQQMSDTYIQGTKDALIQDLERKLKCKDDILHNGNQRLTYEERMARRLLGPQNAASVFENQCSENSQHTSDLRNQNHPSKPRTRSLSEGGSEHGLIQEKCFPPRFLQVPENVIVEEGRFCRIDFKVTGLPNPDIIWYLNGRLIQTDDLHKMIISEKGVHSFIFEVVQARDAGLYKCIATNRAGQAFFNLQLDVHAQECKIPPYFMKKPAATRAYEGDTVQMECQVCARPEPEILLKKNNEMLQYNTDRIRLIQDGSGTVYLFIYNVKKSDDGWYTISAVNEAGIATCHARLDVATFHSKSVPNTKQLKVTPTFGKYSTLSGQRQCAKPTISLKTEEAFQNSLPVYAGLLESDEL